GFVGQAHSLDEVVTVLPDMHDGWQPTRHGASNAVVGEVREKAGVDLYHGLPFGNVQRCPECGVVNRVPLDDVAVLIGGVQRRAFAALGFLAKEDHLHCLTRSRLRLCWMLLGRLKSSVAGAGGQEVLQKGARTVRPCAW